MRTVFIQYADGIGAVSVLVQESLQVSESCFDIPTGICMMCLDGDNRVGGIEPGGALVALPPAPATGNDKASFIGEDNFAYFRVVCFRLTERRVTLRAVGEVDGNGTLQDTRIENGDGQGIANADQIADINQSVDGGNVAFFGQAAQQSFGGAAVLCRLNAKRAHCRAPGRE